MRLVCSVCFLNNTQHFNTRKIVFILRKIPTQFRSRRNQLHEIRSDRLFLFRILKLKSEIEKQNR